MSVFKHLQTLINLYYNNALLMIWVYSMYLYNMHCLKTFLRTPGRQRASHHRIQKAAKRSSRFPSIKIRPLRPSDPLSGLHHSNTSG